MNKVRPKLIAYTHNTRKVPSELNEKFRVMLSNPTFFQVVPPKGKYQYFWSDATNADVIRATFELKDPDVKEYVLGDKAEHKSKAVETEVKKIVESVEPESSEVISNTTAIDEDSDVQTIPDDLSTLKWPELKSLASKFTDKKSFKKDEAIEILNKVKGE